jgi:hypothetical protein
MKPFANLKLILDQKVNELMFVAYFCLAGFIYLRDTYRYHTGKLFHLLKLRAVCIQLPQLHVTRVRRTETMTKWFLVKGWKLHQNNLVTVAHSTCRYPRKTPKNVRNTVSLSVAKDDIFGTYKRPYECH